MVATFYTSCPSSVSQRAALAALAQPARTYDRMVEAFRRRRDLAVAMLREVPGVRVEPPPGSFYLFPDLGEICEDTERFAQELLHREQVVLIPGGAFGPSGERCIRLALTVDDSRLKEALTRLCR